MNRSTVPFQISADNELVARVSSGVIAHLFAQTLSENAPARRVDVTEIVGAKHQLRGTYRRGKPDYTKAGAR